MFDQVSCLITFGVGLARRGAWGGGKRNGDSGREALAAADLGAGERGGENADPASSTRPTSFTLGSLKALSIHLDLLVMVADDGGDRQASQHQGKHEGRGGRRVEKGKEEILDLEIHDEKRMRGSSMVGIDSKASE